MISTTALGTQSAPSTMGTTDAGMSGGGSWSQGYMRDLASELRKSAPQGGGQNPMGEVGIQPVGNPYGDANRVPTWRRPPVGGYLGRNQQPNFRALSNTRPWLRENMGQQ